MTLTYYLNKIAKKQGVRVGVVREQLIVKVDRSLATLYGWEVGRKMPQVGELQKLHKFLKDEGFDINVLDLF